jgi:hypothetical protein
MENTTFRHKIYIQNGFLNSFHSKLIESLNLKNIDQKEYEILNNKLKLLLALFNPNAQIKIDLSKQLVNKIFKSHDGTELDTYEEILIKRLWKQCNNLMIETDSPIFEESMLYLLNSSELNSNDVIGDSNCYTKNNNDSFSEYPLPNSVVGLYVDEKMNGIEKIAHRCRNVFIVDPYLFVDSPNKEKKIPNIVTFLKQLGLDNSKIKCHFSAIVMYDNDTKGIQGKIDEIKKEINNSNLEISVYSIKNSKDNKPKFMGANRYFMTDYCFGEYQHIFDRVGSLSANFFHENAKFDFKTMDYCISEIQNKYKKDVANMGLIQQKFGDILSNPLLKEYE